MLGGFAAGCVLIFAFVAQNYWRSRSSVVQNLQPNCLLTRHPLVFVPGKRSFFYFLGYWNQIPHWLASHGYEVYHLQLPWMDSQARGKALLKFLNLQSRQQRKIHLFVDRHSLIEVESLRRQFDFSCLQSVNLLSLDDSTEPSEPWFWKLHLMCTGQSLRLHQLGWKWGSVQSEKVLARVQDLAERDFVDGAL